MVDFTRRVGLGRPLTYQEADDNFEFVEEQADLAEGFAQDAQGFAITAQNAADSAQNIIDDAVADIEFAVEDNANRIRNLEYGNGPYPSLDLLFTGANLVDPRVEFERATLATYFDEMGVLRTAGPNEPRIDYDPATGECRGLLVEGQATNFVEFSESTFSPSSPAVVVYDYSSSPSGMIDATLIYGDSTNAYVRPQGQETLESGRDYVASVFCKPMGINSPRAAVWLPGVVFNDSASTNGPQCRIDPDGSIVTWGDPDRYGVEELADGWYRVWVSHKAIHTAIPSNLMRFWPISARSDPEDGWLFWGMQIEEGSTPSSYIPTEGSQVTRADDNVSIPTSEFPFNPNEGTLIVSAATRSGETVATLGDIVIVSDSDEMKIYTSPYSSPIGATHLELGDGLFSSVQYFPRELS